MCCFSKPVTHVSGTSIFARTAEAGRQFLVYSMSIEAKEDLAMVLPLPVKLGSDEKGVSFIDLRLTLNSFVIWKKDSCHLNSEELPTLNWRNHPKILWLCRWELLKLPSCPP